MNFCCNYFVNSKQKLSQNFYGQFWKKKTISEYLGYFLKMRTSENRTTEIRRSQNPVYFS